MFVVLWLIARFTPTSAVPSFCLVSAVHWSSVMEIVCSLTSGWMIFWCTAFEKLPHRYSARSASLQIGRSLQTILVSPESPESQGFPIRGGFNKADWKYLIHFRFRYAVYCPFVGCLQYWSWPFFLSYAQESTSRYNDEGCFRTYLQMLCVCCVGHDSFRGFISIINKTTRHIVFRENTTADRWSKSGEVGGRCKDLIPSNFMLKCRHDDHQTTAKHTSLPSITNGYCSIYLQLPPWWLALVAVNMVQPILAVSHHSIRDSLSYCSIHDVDEATRFSSFIRNSLRNSIDTRQNSSPCTEGINLINTINFSSVILGCQLPHIALQFENHQNWQQGAIP